MRAGGPAPAGAGRAGNEAATDDRPRLEPRTLPCDDDHPSAGWSMELVLVAVTVALAAVVVVLVGRLATRRRPPPQARPWERTAVAGSVVVLDLVSDEPSHPSVRRLVEDAAHRALLADPELAEVEVRGRDGRVLGVVGRPPPLPADVTLPPQLHEPHVRRGRAPNPLPHDERRHPPPPGETGPRAGAVRHLADQLHLDERVRAEVGDPDDLLDVVRAILVVAGRDPEVAGGLLRLEDAAVAVMPGVAHDVESELARTFLRIREAGAPRGIVIHRRWIDPGVLRRREAAAPHVRHVGMDAIQRMADAQAAGADPIAFAVGPATAR